MEMLPLVGAIEIAMKAGVQRPVVTTWQARYDIFPRPVAELYVGKIFWWPQVQHWLERTGRRTDADWTYDQVMVNQHSSLGRGSQT